MKNEKSKIEINDLDQISFLSNPDFNKDGSFSAFVRSKADIKNNEYISHIHIMDMKTKKERKLTSGGKEGSFKWMDNENIVFTNRKNKNDEKRDKEEFTPFWKININGGEAEKIFEIPASVEAFRFIDETSLLFTHSLRAGEKPMYKLKDSAKADEQAKRDEEKDYEVFQEIPFWSNGGGFTSKKRSVLCHFDIKTGKITELTPSDLNVQDVSLDEGKNRALVMVSENKGKEELINEIHLLDIKTKKLKKLDTGKGYKYEAEFIKDDLVFLNINEHLNFGLNENATFHTFDLKSGELVKISDTQDFSVGSSINSDMRFGGGRSLKVTKNHVYYVETNDTDALLKRMDYKGNVEILVEDEGSVDAFDVDNKGNILAVIMKKDSLQELYGVIGLKGKKLTGFNDDYLKSRSVSKSEVLRCQGEGDDIIKGFVLKPVGYKKGTKYPGILVVHGGPKTAYGNVFVHEMQIWANKGYFVFFCNPKGSDGKGNEFADIRGRYGTVDYDNLMDFTDKVLDTYPDIDVKNLCVTGGSYGGFMTNWIIGHNTQFKAAASQRSISNWISFFGTSDIGYYFADDQTGFTPWSDHERMWEQSPLKYADKVVTPTLFIHSDADYRCWTPEAYQMFTALKYHGVEARLCLFHGETHELSRSGKPKHRVRRLTEITDWFEKHVEKTVK